MVGSSVAFSRITTFLLAGDAGLIQVTLMCFSQLLQRRLRQYREESQGRINSHLLTQPVTVRGQFYQLCKMSDHHESVPITTA